MTPSLSEELVDGIAIYRISGQCGLTAAVGMVTLALQSGVQGRHRCCMVDGIQLGGFNPPTTSFRLQMVREWARAADGRLHCALMVRRELIDHDKFGVTAARNFGLHSDVFDVEAEPMAWLRDHARISATRGP